MANWLNIAGGAAQGYVQGDEDNRRRREFESMQRQRDRIEKEQKQDDSLAEQLKNVRGAGTYEEDTGDAAAGVTTGPSAVGIPGRATTKTKVTAADADRQRADILSRGGRLKDLQAGATFRQNALATEAAERTERRAQDEDVILKAGRLNSVPGGQVAAVRHLAEAYKQVPDGHQLVVEDRNGVPHVGVSGPDGKYVQQPVPITKEVVDGFIKKGMEMTSVQAAQKGQELGIHQQTADSGRIAAEAAQRNADTAAKEMYWKTIGEGGTVALAKQRAEAAASQAHANYYNAAAAHQRETGKKQTPAEKAKELTDYYTPLIMQANPGMPEATARQHAAAVALRDPNAKATPDVGLAENGIFKKGGKYYKLDAKGNPVPVAFPEDDDALVSGIVKNLPPKPGAAGATPAAATAPEAPDVDGSRAAETKVAAATQALQRYGMRQKRDDPTGFAKASNRLAEAKAELDALNAKYAATQPTGPALRYAPP